MPVFWEFWEFSQFREFFTNLFSKNETKNFEKYVKEFLKNSMGFDNSDFDNRVNILINKTKFGQHFAHIIISNENGKNFNVLLILDEMHRDKEIVRQLRSTPESYIIENKNFKSHMDALQYVKEKATLYRNGKFSNDEASYWRMVKCSLDCLTNPDKYLLPGDYITRNLDGLNKASHAGIYFGCGKVVHYDTKDKAANLLQCTIGNGDHHVHVAKIEGFVSHSQQEIRILVHCFQQATQEDKIKLAIELTEIKYGEHSYQFLTNNCQHFASLVSCGRLEMIDKQLVQDSAVAIGATLAGMVIAGYGAKKLYDWWFTTSDDINTSTTTTAIKKEDDENDKTKKKDGK